MDDTAAVRSLVATLLVMPPDQLEAGTSLRSLDSSLGATRLRLGLKRIGITFASQNVPATYGQLESALSHSTTLAVPPDSQAATPYAVPRAKNARTDDLRIGHDVQDLRSLPDANDYWSHEFYAGSFTPAELAYAVVLSEPKEHFAGFWAAKEALKKCDPAFVDVDLRELTVAHNADGSPCFLYEPNGRNFRLAHSLSISHSGSTASAVVLAPASAAAQ